MEERHICQHCKNKLCASKVTIFSTLSREELEDIVSLIGHKTYRKGEIVFLEGEKSNSLYIINEGQIKLFKYTKEGKEQILHILSEGEFFGEISLLKEEEVAFNAEAITPLKICTLTKEKLNNILLQRPEISVKILESVGERLSKVEKLVKNLATIDVEARMAALLMEFKEQYGVKTSKGIEIKLPLTREDMANYIGVTRETISRKLAKFQQEGFIQLIGNKKIVILNEETLKDYL